MRVYRSSLRIAAGLALSLLSACGGTGGSPTPTAAPTTAPSVVTAPSPQRPTLASPVVSPSSAPVVAATPTATTPEVAGESYEVQSGDTLAIISQQFYGDSTQWRRIYDANKDAIGSDPDKLKVGMKLSIPPKQ